MSRNLKIGLSGAGALGWAHAQTVIAHGAQIVAIHDTQLAAAQKIAGQCGAIATDRLEDLHEYSLDGLIVATPPPVRLDPIRLACENGLHLYVEKPPAYTLAEARVCLSLIEQAGVMAAVGFQLRYADKYELLKELLRDQTVHLVRTVCTIDYYLNFSMRPWFLQKPVSGGPIAEQAIHLLDCVRFLFDNARPVRAIAVGSKNMALDRTEFDAENELQMLYELDNGIHATHMNHCGHEKFCFDLEVVGPHLRLQANVTDSTIHGFLNGEEISVTPPPGALGGSPVAAWLRALETGDASLIRAPYADAIHTQELVDAARKSQATGRFEKVEDL